MSCSWARDRRSFMADLFPSIHFEVVLENRVGSLAKSKTAKNNHRVVMNDAGMLISSVRQVRLIVVGSLWL